MGKDSTISCLSRAKTLSANLSGAVLLHKKTKRLQGRNCLPERDVMISET